MIPVGTGNSPSGMSHVVWTGGVDGIGDPRTTSGGDKRVGGGQAGLELILMSLGLTDEGAIELLSRRLFQQPHGRTSR